MANTTTPGGYKRETKKEGAVSALIQVALAIVIVGAAVFAYQRYTGEKKRVLDLAKSASDAQKGDDSLALLKAKGLFEQIGGEDILMKDDQIVVAMAELQAQLYQGYGMAEMRDPASKYLELAKSRDLKKAQRYAAEAYMMIGDGKAKDAETFLLDLIETKGARDPKLLHALSVARTANGKAKDAVQAAEQGMKLSTQLVRLPVAQGDALLELGNYASAQAAYNHALTLNGNHLRARTGIALSQAIARQAKPALVQKTMDTLLEEANRDHADKPPPRVKAFIEYAKGETFLVDSDAKNALAMAEAALVSDPKLASAMALKARALAKLGKLAEAKTAFDAALTLSPTSVPIAVAASDALRHANKAGEGVAYLEKVKEANPENGLAWVHLSMAQARAGKKESLASADKAIALLGNAHDLAVFAKARALQAQGDEKSLDAAREMYNEALQAHGNPEWPEVYFEMGNLRMAEKNYEDAVTLFDGAVKQWEKNGGAAEDIADAYEATGKAYQGMGKKSAGDAAKAFDKAKELRAGK